MRELNTNAIGNKFMGVLSENQGEFTSCKGMKKNLADNGDM